MRLSHRLFLVVAVVFIVGSTSAATPAQALTITFPEKGFPKVEDGMVLGETTTTASTFGQREESMKATKQENPEKEQAQKLHQLLQTTKPMGLELRKNKDDQDVTVNLRELEKRKESWQTKAGSPNKGEEQVDTVEVKLKENLEIRSAKEGLEVKSSAIKANSMLPIQINTSTKELSVVTPHGVKVVKTLPDTAVAAVQNAGFNGQVVGEVKLETRGEDLVYTMRKEQNKKMFGMIPVTFKQDVRVSATTGEVTATQQSITDRFFNFFSF